MAGDSRQRTKWSPKNHNLMKEQIPPRDLRVVYLIATREACPLTIMISSPSSSPRPALFDRTNVHSDSVPTRPHNWLSLPTPPKDHKAKRPFSGQADPVKKRVKITEEHEESEDVSPGEESDSDIEMEDVAMVRARGLKRTFFRMMNAAAMARPCGIRPSCTLFFFCDVVLRSYLTRHVVSTRPILQSFVSSHKSDVFKCESTEGDSYLSPPYACSYTNGMMALIPFYI